MSIYREADYIVGMRFHACVCALAQGKSIAGLAALDRIKYMCQSVGAGNYVVDINSDFAQLLYERTINHLKNGQERVITESIISKKKETLGFYNNIFREFLS